MQLNDSCCEYVDSGAKAHITTREWLENEILPPVQSIKISNKILHVESCGNVTIQLDTTNTIEVSNVLYIPELSTNLLSVSKIINKNGCLKQHQL